MITNLKTELDEKVNHRDKVIDLLNQEVGILREQISVLPQKITEILIEEQEEEMPEKGERPQSTKA